PRTRPRSVPRSALPQNLQEKYPFLPVRLQAGRLKHRKSGIAALHKRNPLRKGAKWCTLGGSGNNLTEENPPTCPYKRTLRSSNDGTGPWKRKLPKPARIRRSTIFRSWN